MKLNALIVDDERSLRMMLTKMIQKASNQVSIVAEAADGQSALRIVENEKIDLIFLDLQMPGMSGFEFLEAATLDIDTQVILSTADKAFALKAYEYGITDYLLKPYSVSRLKQSIDRAIKRKEESLESTNSKTDSMMLRLLKFMHSREISELKPVPYRDSLIGYHYPFLSIHFDFDKEIEVLNLLQKMEKAGYLSEEFDESIYLCNQCSNSYLNIREVCPKCESGNLKSEDIVHHFACGYVGPLSDFMDDSSPNAMRCPKCEKTLKHIGVDYDKPSAMYNCNNCGAQTQNPLLKSQCKNCLVEVPVENLVNRHIHSYQITENGHIIARSGVNINLSNNEKRSIEGDHKLLRGGTFERSVKKEILRKKQAQFDCSIALIKLENLGVLVNSMDPVDAENLYKDLQEIVFNDIDPLCEIEVSKPDFIFILLPEKNEEKASVMVKQIVSRLELLLYDNYPAVGIQSSMVVETVRETDTFNGLVKKIIDIINSNSILT